jgi:predicted outer membrane repeat protein
VVICVILGVVGARSAGAATIRVSADGSGDHTTVQAAIDAASDGDRIEVGAGTYVEDVDLGGKSLAFVAVDGAAVTVLAPASAPSLVEIGAGSVSFSDFTVQGPGRAFDVSGGDLVLSGLVLEALGDASTDGGALRLSGGSLSLDACTLDANVGAYGGHVYVSGGDLSASETTFSGGVAGWGGALAVSGGTVALDAVTFTENGAGAHGGAVWTGPLSTVEVTKTTFRSNTSSLTTTYGHGGAVYVGSEAALTVTGSTFEGNGSPDWDTVYSFGGALYLDAMATGVITDSAISENLAYYGGGIFLSSWTELALEGGDMADNAAIYGGAVFASDADRLRMSDVRLAGNTSTYAGGALYASGLDDLRCTDCVLEDNLAVYSYGGAFYVYLSTRVGLVGGSIRENLAYYGGGALWLQGGEVGLAELDFVDNRSTWGDGGAVYAYAPTELALLGTVFEANRAYYTGGAVAADSGPLTVSDSQFSDNAAELRGGGALSFTARGAGALTIDASSFTGNEAGADGGAIAAAEVTGLTLADTTLDDNAAGAAGGALYTSGTGARQVVRARFTGNTAAYGGATYAEGPAAPDEWANLQITENEAEFGSAACFVQVSSAALWSSVVLANTSAAGGSVYAYDAALDVRNVVFAENDGDGAVHAGDGASPILAFNNFWENAGGDVGGALAAPDETNVFAEPGFVAWTPDGQENDRLVLWRSSALVDAGHPFWTDEDGSRSDIGLYSGPALALEDVDGDGVSSAWDCDDTDASVHPGAEEQWYDDLDQDCSGGSDWDRDADGSDAAPRGDDCDDADWSTRSCDTGGSPEPDSGADPIAPISPSPVDEGVCGCATNTSALLVFPLALLPALVRRRARIFINSRQGGILRQGDPTCASPP